MKPLVLIFGCTLASCRTGSVIVNPHPDTWQQKGGSLARLSPATVALRVSPPQVGGWQQPDNGVWLTVCGGYMTPEVRELLGGRLRTKLTAALQFRRSGTEPRGLSVDSIPYIDPALFKASSVIVGNILYGNLVWPSPTVLEETITDKEAHVILGSPNPYLQNQRIHYYMTANNGVWQVKDVVLDEASKARRSFVWD